MRTSGKCALLMPCSRDNNAAPARRCLLAYTRYRDPRPYLLPGSLAPTGRSSYGQCRKHGAHLRESGASTFGSALETQPLSSSGARTRSYGGLSRASKTPPRGALFAMRRFFVVPVLCHFVWVSASVELVRYASTGPESSSAPQCGTHEMPCSTIAAALVSKPSTLVLNYSTM